MTDQPNEPVQPAQTQNPTQSPEDVMLRMAGVPKTPEELEAERQAIENERLGRQTTSPNDAAPIPGPTPPEPEEDDPDAETTTTP